MSNQTETKQVKNALRHEGATAPPRPKKKEEEEDCIKVPDYDKHKLDKNCYICAVGHMKQKTPDSLYSQLTELTNGKYVCDGDECFNMMMELAADGDKKEEEEKKNCIVCNEWVGNDGLYFDEDNEMKICQDCGNSEFEDIDENVEKINEFVENYTNGDYIGCNEKEIDAIMKLISKLV